jgi:hypothetical protein
MGQYYKPASLDKKEWLYSWSYGSGLKLMEHSWMRNPLVLAVERLLIPGGAWYKTRIVWSGDYSEKKELISEEIRNEFGEWYRRNHPDYAIRYPQNQTPNVYDMCMDKIEENEDEEKIPSPDWSFKETHPEPLTDKESAEYKFIVNHTKEMFIDKSKVPMDKEGWKVHPLPLITADSNGGGGSYGSKHGENLFGLWCGDIISLEKNVPTTTYFVEFKPDFKEE